MSDLSFQTTQDIIVLWLLAITWYQVILTGAPICRIALQSCFKATHAAFIAVLVELVTIILLCLQLKCNQIHLSMKNLGNNVNSCCSIAAEPYGTENQLHDSLLSHLSFQRFSKHHTYCFHLYNYHQSYNILMILTDKQIWNLMCFLLLICSVTITLPHGIQGINGIFFVVMFIPL